MNLLPRHIAYGAAGLIVAAIAIGAGRALHAPPSAADGVSAGPHRVASSRTQRDAAEELARRHGVRLVIDRAVRAGAPTPAPADGIFDEAQLVAELQRLLPGNELLFHYGGGRLATVWVFARTGDFAVRTPPFGAPAPSAADPRQITDAEAPPELHEIALALGTDAPEGLRVQALDAYVAHPDATDTDIDAMLGWLAAGPESLVAEHARVLRDARAIPVPTTIVPEPIEQRQ